MGWQYLCSHCQVVPDYIADEKFAIVNKEIREVGEAQGDRQHRQTAWLNKKRGRYVKPSEWQPRKRHRKSTFVWLAQMDHQLKSTCGVGLGHFAVKDPRPPWNERPFGPLCW